MTLHTRQLLQTSAPVQKYLQVPRPVHKYPRPHFPLLVWATGNSWAGSHCFAADLSAALPAVWTMSDVGIRWERGQRQDSWKSSLRHPLPWKPHSSLYIEHFLDWQELSIAMSQKMLKAIWVTSQHGNLKTGARTGTASAIKTLSSLSFCHFLGVIFTVKMV